MHTFKVGDRVRQRQDLRRYSITNSSLSTVCEVVEVRGERIRVEVVEHAHSRHVGKRFGVDASDMCYVDSVIVVSEGDYTNHEGVVR